MLGDHAWLSIHHGSSRICQVDPITAPNDLSLAAQDNQLHKHFLILFPKFFETVVKRQSTIYHPDLHKV
jgi:hypothetical protein